MPRTCRPNPKFTNMALRMPQAFLSKNIEIFKGKRLPEMFQKQKMRLVYCRIVFLNIIKCLEMQEANHLKTTAKHN